MEKGKSSTFGNKLWDLFTSIKFAITIFALISIISITGTIIEQQAEPAKNIKLLGRLFGDSSAPAVYNIFTEFGLIDMYRSWWYIALLLLLALNIVICSIHRLPGVLRTIKTPAYPLSNDKIEKMKNRRTLVLSGSPDDIKGTVRSVLKKAGFNPNETGDGRDCRFCSQSASWSRLGIYIKHISIVVIMLGAISGMLFSQESYISLPEGDVSSVTYPLPDSGETEPIPLGFLIRNDNFEVEFYGTTETPRVFKSRVTIIEDGKEILNKTITVNDPLVYRGTTFYLSDYGVSSRRLRQGIFVFRLTSADGSTAEVRLSPGETLNIPGTAMTGKVINFSPALKYEEDGKLSTYTEKLHNPAVHMIFSDSGKELYSGWILKRYPETSLLPDGNRVEFLDYWGVEYAFFRIRKDPGEWLIYPGLVTMGIGLVIALFMSHRKIWVNLVKEDMNTRVIIGATANRYRSSLERKIDKIINALSKRENR